MKSLNGGGRHPEVEVRKLLSDDVISLDDIQKLISKAHSDNIKNGLFYATASQTIEKLRQKIGDGVCFIAEENGKLIGTATVCSKKINYSVVRAARPAEHSPNRLRCTGGAQIWHGKMLTAFVILFLVTGSRSLI